VLALAATLAGCFGGGSNEREGESESFWDESVAESAPAAPAAPEYTVARGDTLYMIAFRRGLDWRELASWNHIAAPYTIYPGQPLKLGPEQPAASASTPATSVAANPEPVERVAPDNETTEGETGNVETYAVRDSGPAQAAPAAPVPSAPKSEAPPPKPAGREPPAETEGSLTRAIRGPANATSAPAAKSESAAPPKQEAAPAKPTQIASAAPPPASAPAPIPAAPSRSAAGTSWRWPAQGALVGRFLPGDPARQGINVQGKPGGTVTAAADGEVVYSGNGLVGYGELIIVKHNGELLSAYGGSGKRLVAEGTKVRSGQPLAELAGNGIVHFEIRRSGKPVDPLEYLPGR